MKKTVLLLFHLCLACLVNAQNEAISNQLRFALNERNASQQVFHLLVQGNTAKLREYQSAYSYTLHYAYGDIASVSCKPNALQSLIEQKLITYAEWPSAHKQPLNDTMLYRNRIKAAKVWTAPLPQAYNGEGVLMGIIDSGTDFTHPDFKDANGLTRIKGLWDQRYNAGSTVPQPYNYGIEWSEAQINANQCTHTDNQYYGHGTHVTGIAAGNGLANGTHEGIASKSDIVIVALDFSKNGPTIADAVHYILSKAAALQKPCVINASVGDYYGSHDATDLEAKLIENMVANKPGVVMVGASGNAGGYYYHTKTTVNNDTSFTWIRNGNNLTYTCYGDTTQFKQLLFTVGANRANFSDLGNIGFKPFSYGLNTLKIDTLKLGNKRIGIVRSSASINPYGVCEWMVQINADTNNLYWRIENTGKGTHQAWNFNLVAVNLPSNTVYPRISKYCLPDTNSTLVSSFQCSKEIITVGNYVNLSAYYDVNNTLHCFGNIAGLFVRSSSIGPTRTGLLKPDVCATGQSVFSCIALTLKNGIIANTPTVVAKGGMHIMGGGTSAASPVVAGVAALYLQRYPNATNREVIAAVQTCAYHDNHTGTVYPNNTWGFGKVDGKSTLYCREGVYNGVSENTGESALNVYPNPISTGNELHFSSNIRGLVCIYDVNGKKLQQSELDGTTLRFNPMLSNYNGLLLVTLNQNGTWYTFKLLKQ